jgi:hypothetical protein
VHRSRRSEVYGRCRIPDIGRSSACLCHAVVCPDVHLLVLHCAPEALDEHVVAPRALSVHADGDAVSYEKLRERITRELAALIRVEDFRSAMEPQSLIDRLDAKSTPSVIDSRQARIRRANQSMTAAR